MQTSSASIVSTRNKLIWLLLTVLGTVTYIAGYFFPQALKVNYQAPKSCPKTIYDVLGYSCDNFNTDTGSTFALEITNIVPENEFVALQGLVTLNNKAKGNDLPLQVEVSAYAVDDSYAIKAVYNVKDPRTINFHCASPSSSSTAMCHPETFVEVVGLERDHYLFVVRFLNVDDSAAQMDSFRLVITSYNADFASYLGIFKIGLFAFAVIGFAIYKGYLSKISTEVTSSEQTYIGYMGLILILFDQPFFLYAPAEDNFFQDVYGVVTISAQSAILVLFWFVLVERLASADTLLSSGGKAFIKIFALIHFGASVVGYTLLAQSQSSNPEEDLGTSRNPLVELYRIYLIGFTAVVSLWTVIRLLRIVRKYKELDWRDSTSFTFSFCYVLCYLFFIATGSLQVTSYKGARVVLLFGITTLYSLLLQVIYVPFEHEIEESEKRRKYETPESAGQFGELDMSDASSPHIKNDKVQLRKADQNQRNKDSESYDEA